MKAAQFYIGLVVVVMAFGFEGCSSSSTNGNSKQSNRSPTGECSSDTDGVSAASCPGQDAYDTCQQNACGAKYEACLGSGYLTGSFSGPCQSTMECLLSCSCDDSACSLACFQNASTACADCMEAASDCEERSGCVEPACGETGSGGTGSGGTASTGGVASDGQGGASNTTDANGGTTAAADGGSSASGEGGSSTASVCPYSSDSLDCAQACSNLKAIATKCQTDPSLSEEIQAVLQLANTGNGTACKASCAAVSPTAMAQWKCFQAVPVAADCTAIAGCTYYNCPQ